MCDQYDNRGCEVVDELHLEITNLEMTIADLKIDFANDLKQLPYKFRIIEVNNFKIKEPEIIYTDWFNLIKKWEAK